MLRRIAAAAAALLAAGSQAAPVAASEPIVEEPLVARAEQIARLFGDRPSGFEGLFAPEFLAAVPPARLEAIFRDYHGKLGVVTRTRPLPGSERYQGTFEYTFAKGFTVKADMAVATAPPHRIIGLLLGNPVPQAGSLEEVARQIAGLPGATTFAVAKLGPDGPVIHATHRPDAPLAIGSAFKLWVLGALIDDVAVGKRRWDQVVALTEAGRSHPSGKLHGWPVGAPMTLHTLAALMISESDNTATDTLIRALGRERVERAVAAMGVRQPDLNRPLLTTLEMFKLKAGKDPGAIGTWVAKDEAARRAWLAGPVAAMARDDVQVWDEPRALAELEWFASAADMARMMRWLRDATEKGPAARGRAVLAINPGVRLDPKVWPFVGFKGGSEPGVVAAAFLMKRADGSWWTITGAWNDPARPVAEERFFGLLERAADLVAAIS